MGLYYYRPCIYHTPFLLHTVFFFLPLPAQHHQVGRPHLRGAPPRPTRPLHLPPSKISPFQSFLLHGAPTAVNLVESRRLGNQVLLLPPCRRACASRRAGRRACWCAGAALAASFVRLAAGGLRHLLGAPPARRRVAAACMGRLLAAPDQRHHANLPVPALKEEAENPTNHGGSTPNTAPPRRGPGKQTPAWLPFFLRQNGAGEEQ